MTGSFCSESQPLVQQRKEGCRTEGLRLELERTFEFADRLISVTLIPMSATTTSRALDTRFDRRLAEIIDYATEIFADKGYEGASMRDLSRLSGISLAGLYYYFESKEKLLYFIQQHTFTTIIERLRQRLATTRDPEARIRIFVHNHVDYSVAKTKAMKVLSHEDDVLKNGYGTELAATKREYYRICFGLVDDLAKADGLKPAGDAATQGDVSTRTAVMGLFGMMNWLYTWYRPQVDPDAAVLAREISDIFLRGIRARKNTAAKASLASKQLERATALKKKTDTPKETASSGKRQK